MKIKYVTLLESETALGLILEFPFPIKYSLAILKYKEQVDRVAIHYNEEINRLFDKHGTTKDNEVIITEDKQNDFKNDINSLCNTEIEIDNPNIPISLLNELNIAPNLLSSISFILDFDN